MMELWSHGKFLLLSLSLFIVYICRIKLRRGVNIHQYSKASIPEKTSSQEREGEREREQVHRKDGKSTIPTNASGFDLMGQIIPVPEDFDVNTTGPGRFYKLAPKYFLTMGLTNTTISEITHIDTQYLSRLTERRKILSAHPDAVACLPAATPAVKELYTFLVSHYLPQRYPSIFTINKEQKHLHNNLTTHSLPLSPPDDPLKALSSLVTTIDEDFIMLVPTPTGELRCQAYIWCYPIGFLPSDKLGKTLRDVHKPVPGYEKRLAGSMDRYFGGLKAGRVVRRSNWSITTRPKDLWDVREEYHVHDTTSTPQSEKIDPSTTAVRSELQTLFALPESRAKVMSLHLYVYPLEDVKADGDGEVLAAAIEGLTEGNVPEMWRYKGAVRWGESVMSYLRS